MFDSIKTKRQQLQARWQRIPKEWHDEKPARYRMAVAVLALAGYGYLLAFPVLVLYTSVHLAFSGWPSPTIATYMELGLLAIAATGTLLLTRAQFPLPGGEPVALSEAPRLYGMLDEIRQELQTAPVHEVRVTGEFEVRMIRTPTNGFPFVSTNTMLIGMPVLQCFSERQLKAWVASQMGEVSIHYSHLTSWISQLREVWVQYRNYFAAEKSLGNLLLGRFFNLYTRVFHRFTAPLMHDHQYVRDRYALRMLGDEDTAEWMIMQTIMGRFLEQDYWPSVYHIAEKAPEPTINPFRNLGLLLRRRLNENDAKRWLREAYARAGGTAAMPTLKQRLQAIAAGETEFYGVPGITAADSLLEDHLHPLLERVDAAWQARERDAWLLRHQKSCSERERLDALKKDAEAGRLKGRRAMEYAALMKRYGTTAEAHEAYEHVLASNEDDAQIVFGVGKFFTSLGEERGIQLLEKAMEMDKHFIVPACRMISEFRNQRGSITRFPAHEGQTIKRRVS